MEAGSGPHRHVVQRRRHPRLAAPRGARGRRRLLLLQGPRRARRLRRAGRRRQARLRAAAPAAQGRRAARAPGHPRHARRCSRTPARSAWASRRPRASPAPPAWTAARRRVFVITGDGELQEGQFWESLGQAANEDFGEITAIVDHNKIQSDTWVEHVSDLGDLEAKGRAFGWAVARCDGNDMAALSQHAHRAARAQREPPEAADRRHGQGRGRGDLHAARAGASPARRCTPTTRARRPRSSTAIAIAELVTKLAATARPRPRAAGGRGAAPRRRRRRRRSSSTPTAARCWPPADRREDLVALDADLYLDCGLIPFRGAHPGPLRRVRHRRDGHGLPGRHAGARAASCRSCTRSPASSRRAPASRSTTTPPRARRSSTAASWPGSSPAGRATRTSPIRDIALMGSVPGHDVPGARHARPRRARCVEYAVDEATGPGLPALRLRAVGARLRAARGRAAGHAARAPSCARAASAAIVCTGPVLAQPGDGRRRARRRRRRDRAAVAARRRRRLARASATGGAPVVVLDNHFVSGGQGDAVRAALRRARCTSGASSASPRAAATTRSCAPTASTRARSPPRLEAL